MPVDKRCCSGGAPRCGVAEKREVYDILERMEGERYRHVGGRDGARRGQMQSGVV
eukprot:IDg3858t1